MSLFPRTLLKGPSNEACSANPKNDISETLVNKEGDAYWQNTLLLDQCRSDVPHMTCLVADQAEMRDDNLLTSELWCALGLMAGRLRISPYYKHGIVPVSNEAYITSTQLTLIR